MTERNEREILLAVATEKKWQRWIKKQICIGPETCLFCKAYGFDVKNDGGLNDACIRCTGHYLGCQPGNIEGPYLSNKEMFERARKRLQRAGIVP
jgi:hypothetical protein